MYVKLNINCGVAPKSEAVTLAEIPPLLNLYRSAVVAPDPTLPAGDSARVIPDIYEKDIVEKRLPRVL